MHETTSTLTESAPRPGRLGRLGCLGSELICDVLAEHGVDTVFGYAGGAILELYDALHRDPRVRHVTVRHEQAAAHAAAGWARATGRAGVCIATSGPGATNLITGIMDAHMDSTPMVVLTGQVHSRLIGYDAFQEADLVSMTAPVTKHGFQPRTAEELGPMLRAAFAIAETGRPGPVLVDLPNDLLMAMTDDSAPLDLLESYRPVPAIDAAAIDRAATALRNAERPLLLLGGGVTIAEAGPAVLALAERLQIPIVTTITAKGVVPESHPLVHGMIGMYGRRSGIWGLLECDVLIGLGCRFTDRITGRPETFARGRTLVHVDIDAYELGKNLPASVAVQADARQGAAALLAATAEDRPSEARRSWARRMTAARAICQRCVPYSAPVGVHPQAVMEAVNAAKRPEDIVTTGVGQHQMFACHFLEFERPRSFITSAGAGTMGFGLPAAIGAAMARPGARAFVIDGDGSFQMMQQELATTAQETLPITILLLDNGGLGMVRQWQDRVYDGRHEAVHFTDAPGHPDFVRLASAYGIPAEEVTTEADLGSALARAIEATGPALIRILIDPRIDNAPMMPAGSELAAYHGHCVAEPGRPFDAAERREIEETTP